MYYIQYILKTFIIERLTSTLDVLFYPIIMYVFNISILRVLSVNSSPCWKVFKAVAIFYFFFLFNFFFQLGYDCKCFSKRYLLLHLPPLLYCSALSFFLLIILFCFAFKKLSIFPFFVFFFTSILYPSLPCIFEKRWGSIR